MWLKIVDTNQKCHSLHWQARRKRETDIRPKIWVKYRSSYKTRSTLPLSIDFAEKKAHGIFKKFLTLRVWGWNIKPTYWVQQIGFEPCKLILNDLSPSWNGLNEQPERESPENSRVLFSLPFFCMFVRRASHIKCVHSDTFLFRPMRADCMM